MLFFLGIIKIYVAISFAVQVVCCLRLVHDRHVFRSLALEKDFTVSAVCVCVCVCAICVVAILGVGLFMFSSSAKTEKKTQRNLPSLNFYFARLSEVL